jgi:FixJ family two-component response regulator
MPIGADIVYIVDDDDSIRRALKRLLKSAGYQTLTFESAEAFLEFIPDKGGGCLVLDIQLPGMTGFDLQEMLVSRSVTYRIIFMTAYDDKQYQERAEKRDAVAFLRKPFGEQALLDAIGKCRQQMEASGKESLICIN